MGNRILISDSQVLIITFRVSRVSSDATQYLQVGAVPVRRGIIQFDDYYEAAWLLSRNGSRYSRARGGRHGMMVGSKKVIMNSQGIGSLVDLLQKFRFSQFVGFGLARHRLVELCKLNDCDPGPITNQELIDIKELYKQVNRVDGIVSFFSCLHHYGIETTQNEELEMYTETLLTAKLWLKLAQTGF